MPFQQKCTEVSLKTSLVAFFTFRTKSFGGTEEIPAGSSHYINHQSIGNAIAAVILLNYDTTNGGQLFCTCI